jgi:hypothetical protein
VVALPSESVDKVKGSNNTEMGVGGRLCGGTV